MEKFINNIATESKKNDSELSKAVSAVLDADDKDGNKGKLAALKKAFKAHEGGFMVAAGLTLAVVGGLMAIATAVGGAIVAAIGLAVAIFGANKYLDDRKADLALKVLNGPDKVAEAVEKSPLAGMDPLKFLDGNEQKKAVTAAKVLISNLNDIVQEQEKKDSKSPRPS